MSAPAIWILFPAGLGMALLFFLRQPRLMNSLAIGSAFLLAWAALLLPINQPLVLGSINYKITETFFILGRTLTLTAVEQPLLMALWGVTFLWLAGSLFAQPPSLFAPIALLTVALLTAALTVDPFLYAALMFELVALLALPLLAPPGRRSRQAAMRFLAYITLGMPFILFVGWLLAGVAASPGILVLVVRAGALLGVGFAFLLAIFPFHAWVPQLAEEANPYAAAFLFLLLFSAVGLFGLDLIDRFVWLRESQTLAALLLGAGALMALVGGLFAGLERHLGRALGYAVLLETGLSLLAVGSGGAALALFFGLLLPRAISLLVWAAALSNWQVGGVALTLGGVRGLARRTPYHAAALLLAVFSLAGLPGLAGFPFRLLLAQALALHQPLAAAAVLLGSLGLLAAGLRLLTALVDDSPEDSGVALDTQPLPAAPARVDFAVWLFIGLATAGSMLVGLFPQWFWPFITRLPAIFTQLGR